MRTRLSVSAMIAIGALVCSALLGAQQEAPPSVTPPVPPPGALDAPNFLPLGPPANLPPSAVPDLSGDWELDRDRGGIGQSMSAADPRGQMRGKEPDIPYQPWALEYTMAQFPPTGPDSRFELTTDPHIHTCEPLGLGRIYMYPAKTKFIQTPEAVYILHELGPAFRIVWMNTTHPDDPDPQYWGHSVGWYEDGDTLVVDTVGVNDRSWLDQLGHPRTERFHFIERYKKVGDALELEMTVDDPGAYTAPWPGSRNFRKSETGFMRYQWVCSVRDNNEHYQKVGAAGNPGATTFQR